MEALLVLTAMGIGAGAPEGKLAVPRDHSDLRCGAYCLFVSLTGLELWERSFAELETALGQPTVAGYSMAQLEKFAREQGAHTLAIETDLDRLPRRGQPFACIALLEGNHFVNVYDMDKQQVYVIDPPKEYAAPLDTFRLLWTRKALLISKAPLALASDWGAWWWAVAVVGSAGGAAVVVLWWRKRRRQQ